jgi:hypothetical protein
MSASKRDRSVVPGIVAKLRPLLAKSAMVFRCEEGPRGGGRLIDLGPTNGCGRRRGPPAFGEFPRGAPGRAARTMAKVGEEREQTGRLVRAGIPSAMQHAEVGRLGRAEAGEREPCHPPRSSMPAEMAKSMDHGNRLPSSRPTGPRGGIAEGRSRGGSRARTCANDCRQCPAPGPARTLGENACACSPHTAAEGAASRPRPPLWTSAPPRTEVGRRHRNRWRAPRSARRNER